MGFLANITMDQAKAFGRHARTAVLTGAGTLAGMKIISGGDLSTLQTSFDQISHGVSEIVLGVTALATLATGIIAAVSANPVFQMLRGLMAVSKDPAKIEQVKEAASIEQKAALVAATDNLDEVKGVPLKPTDEGRTIASLVPSPTAAVSNAPAPGEGVGGASPR